MNGAVKKNIQRKIFRSHLQTAKVSFRCRIHDIIVTIILNHKPSFFFLSFYFTQLVSIPIASSFSFELPHSSFAFTVHSIVYLLCVLNACHLSYKKNAEFIFVGPFFLRSERIKFRTPMRNSSIPVILNAIEMHSTKSIRLLRS